MQSEGAPSDDRALGRALIRARWRDIVILSWPTEDDLLLPYLPPGMEIDRWDDEPYISLVCLRMERLRVFGIPAIPRSFSEVNLRFYVRPQQPDDTRRGVVFLRQLVSSRLVALGGRIMFRESMSFAPVRHEMVPDRATAGHDFRIGYSWTDRGDAATVRATPGGDPFVAQSGSLEEFLTARHWGYNNQSTERVRSYRIAREPWKLNPVSNAELQSDVEHRWAGPFADVMSAPPSSALFVSSSDASVHLPSNQQPKSQDASRPKLR